MNKKAKSINLLKEVEVKEVKKAPKVFNFKTHKIKAKDFFIPHKGNNHHPHMLHTKRALFYSLFFIAVKAVVFVFTISIPLQAFMMPDILKEQRNEVLRLVAETRAANGLEVLSGADKLYSSSQNKSEDMVENSYFSHVSPESRDLKYFLDQVNYSYRYAGENLAMGFSDAKSVVSAWIKSPLHYQNIMDGDFSETGMGIASGDYKGKETVFIAQHFGAPISQVTKAPEEQVAKETERVVAEKPVKDEVLGEKVETEIIAKKEPAVISEVKKEEAKQFLFNKEESSVFWKYDGKNTTLNIKAYIEGDFKEARVYVGDYAIKLKADEDEENLYAGSLTAEENIDNFFRPVITPSIVIRGLSGEEAIEAINWYRVKVVEQTPVEKYQAARDFLPFTKQIFNFSNFIYIIAAVVLIIVLLLTILVEIKKQHPHVIVQTLAVLVLLSTLLVI
jgi:uncharacterized protein YkwD